MLADSERPDAELAGGGIQTRELPRQGKECQTAASRFGAGLFLVGQP